MEIIKMDPVDIVNMILDEVDSNPLRKKILRKIENNINQKYQQPYFKPFIPLTIPEIVFSKWYERVGCLMVETI